MKKGISAVIVACCLVLTTSPALAKQERPNKPSVMFYEFGPSFIEGILSGPGLTNFHLRGKVTFGRLSHLKKSFIPTLLASRPPVG